MTKVEYIEISKAWRASAEYEGAQVAQYFDTEEEALEALEDLKVSVKEFVEENREAFALLEEIEQNILNGMNKEDE